METNSTAARAETGLLHEEANGRGDSALAGRRNVNPVRQTGTRRSLGIAGWRARRSRPDALAERLVAVSGSPGGEHDMWNIADGRP